MLHKPLNPKLANPFSPGYLSLPQPCSNLARNESFSQGESGYVVSRIQVSPNGVPSLTLKQREADCRDSRKGTPDFGNPQIYTEVQACGIWFELSRPGRVSILAFLRFLTPGVHTLCSPWMRSLDFRPKSWNL